MGSSPSGICPGCGLMWGDRDPGEEFHCPKCESTNTLVDRETYTDTSPSE